MKNLLENSKVIFLEVAGVVFGYIWETMFKGGTEAQILLYVSFSGLIFSVFSLLFSKNGKIPIIEFRLEETVFGDFGFENDIPTDRSGKQIIERDKESMVRKESGGDFAKII